MVVDGASLHVAKALVIPENIRLLRLPPYSPELNPQEHVWDEIREKEFPNRVFSDMAGVVRTLEEGLPQLAADRDRVRSICAWPWIVSLTLKANCNERHCGMVRLAAGRRPKPQAVGSGFRSSAAILVAARFSNRFWTRVLFNPQLPGFVEL
jgi:hypothetical protein